MHKECDSLTDNIAVHDPQDADYLYTAQVINIIKMNVGIILITIILVILLMIFQKTNINNNSNKIKCTCIKFDSSILSILQVIVSPDGTVFQVL